MAIRKSKAPSTIYFIPVGEFADMVFKGGSWTISSGYNDREGKIKDNTQNTQQAGRYIEFVASRDEKGRDKAKRYSFNQSIGRLMSRTSDTDIYGRSLYDFLKNHPECEGSPNGVYEIDSVSGKRFQIGITFRELNGAKDAAQALESDRFRNKAESLALDLDAKTLEEVANIRGYFGEVDDQMLLHVVEFARKDPAGFMSIYESDDRSFKALIRRAVSKGIFRQYGPMFKWDNMTVGNTEADAIATLRKDKAILQALQEKLGDLKPAVAEETGK